MNRYYVEILNCNDKRISFYMYAENPKVIKNTIEYNAIITIDQTD
tara:strand:- start:79 stop:213 length:135 start_codon:yes stop_codon:yes gene_type:complete